MSDKYFGVSKSSYFRLVNECLEGVLDETESDNEEMMGARALPVFEGYGEVQDVMNVNFENKIEDDFETNVESLEIEEEVEDEVESDVEDEVDSDVENEVESDVEDEEDRVCEDESKLVKDLRHLVISENCTVSFTNKILNVLRDNGHKELPKTRATLVHTPRSQLNLRDCPPGDYFHFGIEESLLQFPENSYPASAECIMLDIGIDGLPLSRSSTLCLWPILASFSNVKEVTPFVVGAYAGYGKPFNVDCFMKDFVEEVNDLHRQGGVYVTKKEDFQAIQN